MLTAISPKSVKITEVKRCEDVLCLSSDHCETVLEPKSSGIVRVVRIPAEEKSEQVKAEGSGSDDGSEVGLGTGSDAGSDVMERIRTDKPGVTDTDVFSDWEYTEDEDEIRLTLPELKVCVYRDCGSIACFDRSGNLLFSERTDAPVEFEEFETFKLADTKQKTKIIETADGRKEVLEAPEKVSTGNSFHIRFNFELGDEALYGLGQQEKGFASLRGRTLYIHQGNRKIAVPMLVSTGGYGFLVDAYSPIVFNDNEKGTYIYIEAAKELDYYFIAGDMNGVVQGYRKLTGKAALLPKWAYGYVQSQERYESQEEILSTVKKSRELGIGMDCIVLDWISWPDGEWGQKSYDHERFPDPKGMIDKLHEEHVHFMISLWPTMAENTSDHKEFEEKKLFLPACSVYDAFKPEARELYFDQLKRTHFSYGTDAWWCDSSEPFTPEWNHKMRMEEGELFHAYCDEAGLRMPYEYCNAFPLYHAMGIYENQRKAMGVADIDGKTAEVDDSNRSTVGVDDNDGSTAGVDDNDGSTAGVDDNGKRVINLTRSAYTGQQRYGTVMWSGDTDASWETFKDQIAIGLHFSASGLPWWTMDTGAFFVKRGEYWYWNGKYDETVDDPAYCELYVRWYQYAAFLPMFRAHGTDCRRELWNFKGEYYDALLKANRLRYSLMPYIYSEAGKVWLNDKSLIRWLAFDFTDDKKTWEIMDQFMFGECLMVCPVTEPMGFNDNHDMRSYCENENSTRSEWNRNTEVQDEAGASRTVYFPSGCDWYDFYTGEKHAGGTTAAVSAKLDEIPLFVKAGSLIPMHKPALSTEEQTDDIEWKKYGDGEVSYELYEDAGDGYGYERGEYTLKNVRM